MNENSFDQYAMQYDAWFLKNPNVLYSEAKLVAHFLKDSCEIFSVGCGSGLFEMILKKEFNINVEYGLEPSKEMAEIAIKRGVKTDITTIENADIGIEKFDAILFNGTPGYITDLQKAFDKAYAGLRKNGRIVVIDIPKESSYALLYNLAKTLGTWDHPLLKGAHPKDPYPIEFVKMANWRTTGEKTEMLTKSGFTKLKYAQTLTKHPVYSDQTGEEPVEGYDCGDYVAICGFKN